MSLAAALVLIAQSTAPIAAPAPVFVAERARATVTVVRPARISLSEAGEVEIDSPADPQMVQRRRDAAGTVWIEFS